MKSSEGSVKRIRRVMSRLHFNGLFPLQLAPTNEGAAHGGGN